MALTLNIIEHELQGLGRVELAARGSETYSGFRLFVESVPLDNPAMLYLCDSRSDVGRISDAGYSALYVNTVDDLPDHRAVMSVLQGESLLVVFNALLDTAFRYGEWERAMDNVCYTDGDLQELVDISTPFLQNNVVVLDPALKLLAHTTEVPCDDPVTVELISHGYHTEENITKFQLHKRFKLWSGQHGFIINDTYQICKYVTVVKTFKTKLSFSLIIVMSCNVVPLQDYLLDIYSMFAERVGFYAQRDYPDDKPSGNAVDTFIRDLALDKPLALEAAYERNKSLGIPYEARFCLFYMRSESSSIPSQLLLSDVAPLVAPAKTVLIDDAVVVLCFNCRNDRCALHCTSNVSTPCQTSLSARIDDLMERYGLFCGRSSKFTSLSSTAAAYKQAEWAYRIGKSRLNSEDRLTHLSEWSRIATFDTCQVDYLVQASTQGGTNLARLTYAGHMIDQIYEQDSRSKTDNYSFLYEYLMCERRASIVAEKMHMHRNNVKYRIDRIEEQFGIDTSDPILRLDLLFAYWVRDASTMQLTQ